jgi:hypothetical protein
VKPWEESWGYATHTQTGNCAELHLGDGQQICVQIGIDDEADAYAQLAACAPEMARLLLDLDDSDMFPDVRRQIVAVLRKAGVRP